MRRREFIGLLGSAAVWPLTARAQQPAMPVVGFLSVRSSTEADYVIKPFLRGLGESGYVEGQNVAIEYRWAENRTDLLPALAADLVSRRVDVIVAGGTSQVAKAATTTIPIVFTTGQDPVVYGLVERLNRPGGNITGATFYSGALGGKQLELLRELVPKAGIVGMLVNPGNASAMSRLKEAQAAAQLLGQQVRVLNARNEQEIDLAFASLAQLQVGAVLVSVDPLFDSRPELLVAFAARHAMPTIYYLREFVTAGGLICYGASISDTYRQAGVYAGRILKGERPGDLPIMLPTKFDVVVNLKTAKALRIEVPISILLRADEVIE